MPLPGPTEIRAAHAVIAPHIRRTPLIEAASPVAGASAISLKLDLLQHSGSFKARGAFHNLLTRAAPAVGCATASGGNHGAAVAFAAQALGVRAKIFVPEIANPTKIEKIRRSGADVHVEGARYADAQALCDAYVAATGALSIHPFDADATIAGAGTVGLEWEGDLAALGQTPLDTVLIAVGGGGLVAGVAAWFENRVKVVAVEPTGSRALFEARRAGAPVDVEVESVAADSLGAKRVGARNFAIAARFVADCVLVEDQAIVAAQRRLWRDFCLVTEPGGAAAYAALADGAYRPEGGERVGVLLCGGNVDLAAFAGVARSA